MSHFDEVLASPEWAFAFAAALEQRLDDDRILTVGSARPSVGDVVGDEATRSVTLRFTTADGYRGMITLNAIAAFAETLERSADDDVISTPCVTGFDAAIRTIAEQAVVEVDAEPEYEIDGANGADDGVEDESDGDIAVFPLLDGGDVLASLTLRISASADPELAGRGDAVTAAAAPAAMPAAGRDVSSASSYVLADVQMGVTAELGRCRMTMRELLSITPGAVIDLDRPAGAPVDVLVNGTLIARGEVVVVDEEFGIRISELVAQPAAH